MVIVRCLKQFSCLWKVSSVWPSALSQDAGRKNVLEIKVRAELLLKTKPERHRVKRVAFASIICISIESVRMAESDTGTNCQPFGSLAIDGGTSRNRIGGAVFETGADAFI